MLDLLSLKWQMLGSGDNSSNGPQDQFATSNWPPHLQESVSSLTPNGDLLLYGGINYPFFNETDSQVMNLMWTYRISSQEWKWKNASTSYGRIGIPDATNWPPPLHSAVIWTTLDGTSFYMYGGSLSQDVFVSDLWQFNMTTNLWTWLGNGSFRQDAPGKSNSQNWPGSVESGATWLDPSGNFVLFGGSNTNHLWRYVTSTSQWTYFGSGDILGTVGTVGTSSPRNWPAAGESFSTWVHGGNLYLYGGHVMGDGDADLWRYGATLFVSVDNSSFYGDNFGITVQAIPNVGDVVHIMGRHVNATCQVMSGSCWIVVQAAVPGNDSIVARVGNLTSAPANLSVYPRIPVVTAILLDRSDYSGDITLQVTVQPNITLPAVPSGTIFLNGADDTFCTLQDGSCTLQGQPGIGNTMSLTYSGDAYYQAQTLQVDTSREQLGVSNNTATGLIIALAVAFFLLIGGAIAIFVWKQKKKYRPSQDPASPDQDRKVAVSLDEFEGTE
eukprot:TRINITY_DN1499_c0_g1_i1.p1 TRINITY_DN1499_c0_g1~~TRINITY_DN1499_c0_g1_i1.p1  ORF type:complete len:498 (+),score=117.11 TRINITY_DN1499_c0_g1_i1:215-1708(+)